MSEPEVTQSGSMSDQAEAVREPTAVMVDASMLASVLNQARGPILDRIKRQVPQFTGDGSVDVSAWLTEYERYCGLESVSPTDLLAYMLGGNAARVYGRMMVGEASKWEVVKAVLTGEYAMPRQEAWRQFVSHKLQEGDSVDVYLDRLERYAGRLGLSTNDLSFRVKFFEGLPASVYEWAVTHEGAYSVDFGTLLSRVRGKLASKRAVGGRGEVAQSTVAAAASGKQRDGRASCFRCGGPHRVKNCTVNRKAFSGRKNSSGKRAGCFRCGDTDHWVQECPKPPAAAAGLESQPGFQEGDATRGAASSAMNTNN